MNELDRAPTTMVARMNEALSIEVPTGDAHALQLVNALADHAWRNRASVPHVTVQMGPGRWVLTVQCERPDQCTECTHYGPTTVAASPAAIHEVADSAIHTHGAPGSRIW